MLSRVGGVWKRMLMRVKVAGRWRVVTRSWVKVAGQWRTFSDLLAIDAPIAGWWLLASYTNDLVKGNHLVPHGGAVANTVTKRFAWMLGKGKYMRTQSPVDLRFNATGHWGIMMWVYLTSHSHEINLWGVADNLASFSCKIMGPGSQHGHAAIMGTGQQTRISKSQIPLNQWVHIAFGYDGNQVRIGINGATNVAQGVSSPHPIPAVMQIGETSTAVPDFWVTDIRYYGRLLTETELHTLYTKTLNLYRDVA